MAGHFFFAVLFPPFGRNMFIGANQSESGNFKRCGNRQKGNELERHIADRKYHAHLLMMRTNEPDWLLNYCLLFKQKKNCRKIEFLFRPARVVRASPLVLEFQVTTVA